MNTDAPLWFTWLKASLEANTEAHARFVQLANVDRAGRPRVRSLCFRFFGPRQTLIFSTDLQSEKCAHLAVDPAAEICWYFAATREQFRIAGTVQLIESFATGVLAAMRAEAWSKLAPAMQQSFTWPESGAPWSGQGFDLPTPTAIPASFALLMLQPEQLDYLDLRPHPQQRWRFERSADSWQSARVNP
jgi:PPOX class probable FMN-dependent enzyme